MSKFATSLFLIFSIVTVTMCAPVLGQGPLTSQTDKAPDTAESTNRPNLKAVFSVETERFRAESAVFDPITVDRDKANQQAQKKGWSKTKKTLVITAIAVGFAALVFLVVKYGKDCIRSTPEDCNPVTDENCVCHEYERRNP